jgi:hypothetical protein
LIEDGSKTLLAVVFGKGREEVVAGKLINRL